MQTSARQHMSTFHCSMYRINLSIFVSDSMFRIYFSAFFVFVRKSTLRLRYLFRDYYSCYKIVEWFWLRVSLGAEFEIRIAGGMYPAGHSPPGIVFVCYFL